MYMSSSFWDWSEGISPWLDLPMPRLALQRCLQFSSRVPKETCWKCENLGEGIDILRISEDSMNDSMVITFDATPWPKMVFFIGAPMDWAQDISPWFPTLSLFWFLLETLICMYYWGKWGESPGYPLRVSLKMRSQQVLCRKALKKERAANIETKSHRIHSN